VVPVQAVQTGPESRFVFVVGEDRRVATKPVVVSYLEGAIAVVTGVEPGARIVVEGAQNLRNGSLVTMGETRPGDGKARGVGKGEGKGEGKGKAGGAAPT
jgi:hypothetical protein